MTQCNIHRLEVLSLCCNLSPAHMKHLAHQCKKQLRVVTKGTSYFYFFVSHQPKTSASHLSYIAPVFQRSSTKIKSISEEGCVV